jgi:hypothetical protein
VNNGTAGSGIGVWGEQKGSGYGVYGIAPNGYGVVGIAADQSGIGVFGKNATGGVGVQGEAATSVGVRGFSDSGVGVQGVSNSAAGVNAYGKPALLAEASPNASNAAEFKGNIDVAGSITAHDSGKCFFGAEVFAGGFTTYSDRRLKQNIAAWQAGELLTKVAALRPVTYQMIRTPDEPAFGLIAQEIEPFFPEVVHKHLTKEHGDTYGIDYAKLSVVALAAIQQLHAQAKAKDAEIADLRARLERLEAALTNKP